jgi:hypothetical protein
VDDMEGSTNPIEKESRGKDENSVAKKRKLLAFYSLWYQLWQVFWN